jgi:hypothetical protein
MEVVYEQQWTTYEEWGGIRISESKGAFYAQDGGYSVMGNGNEPDWDEYYSVSGENVLKLIDEWEEIANEDDKYWGS